MNTDPLPFMDLSVPLPDISAEALRQVSSLFPRLPYAPGEQNQVEKVVLEISKQAKLGFTCVHLNHSISDQFARALEEKGLTVVRRWWISTRMEYIPCRGFFTTHCRTEDVFITWGKENPPSVRRYVPATDKEHPHCDEVFDSKDAAETKLKALLVETKLWNEEESQRYQNGLAAYMVDKEASRLKRSSPPAGCLPILAVCAIGLCLFFA